MRTSTLTLVVPPTRWNVWSTSTRRILPCVSIGMSATSLMNSVPPWASSSAPALRCCSPLVWSMPNSSLSIRSGTMPAALMATNGPSARDDMRVQLTRRHLLAAARRADDQDAAVGLGRALDGLAQLVHRRGVADQRGRDRRQLFQLPDLALQSRGLQRAVGDQDQPVGLERLLDEVVGALLDRGDRGFDVAVAGDHHHRHFGMVHLDDVEQLQTVELRALQPDVEEHHARPARRNLGDRRIAVARGTRAKALVLENAGDQLADVGFVVDDQDIVGHDKNFSGGGWSVDGCSRGSSMIDPARMPVRPRQSAGASTRRAGRAESKPRRSVQCDRHALRARAPRSPGPVPSPFRASSRKAPTDVSDFPSAGQCRCRRRR